MAGLQPLWQLLLLLSVPAGSPSITHVTPHFISRLLHGKKRISAKDHVGMCGMCAPIHNLQLKQMPEANMSSITCWPPANLTHPGQRAPLTIFSMTANLPPAFTQCLTVNNRLSYARLHGFEYCSGDAIPTTVVMNMAWHKLIALQGLLRERPLRPAVFFMDADALIMNMDFSLLALLAKYPTKKFLFGSEYSNCDREGRTAWQLPRPIRGIHACDPQYPECPAFRRINGGTFIIRNSEASRAVLDRIYSQGLAHPHGLGDPDHLRSTDTLEWERWRVNGEDFCDLAVTLPQQVINSMRKVYLPGDFVYHLAGGGLSGSNIKRRSNPKYSFLTSVCNKHSLEATPAMRHEVERMLANFTDQSRMIVSTPKSKGDHPLVWPPIAQAYLQ
ncbi:hypothetical protein AB1Y20_023121 [Prymnesium parvum]|uniref:Nucleotide-diphospho-sugar transferase domain-containing protein n=1 Tax=Prymnesium parvum TaxID=97485 RepID=A0AB34JFB2_PRYPA